MSIKHRLTPIMGWASWNCFHVDVTEQRLKEQADAMVRLGLTDCGYEYINCDDGFFGGRAEDGTLKFHKERFPNGIKVVADYIHSLGLKAGIYSDGGNSTCAYHYDFEGENGYNVGLYGHEEQDLSMFFEECGFDFIKVDWCGGIRKCFDDKEQYTKIAKIIDEIRERQNREIVFNICRWRFPGEWAVDICDSWRTGMDITCDFKAVVHQLDNVKALKKYCSPGHTNDLDMMEIGNGLTPAEERSHFSMWCMMSTPLILGCDLTKISGETLEIIKNKEVIALNQDALCSQGYVIKEYSDDSGNILGEIWIKNLSDENSKAIAFLNRGDDDLNMSLKLTEAGFMSGAECIRDLWKHEDIEFDDELNYNVEPHGVVLLKLTGDSPQKTEDVNENIKLVTDYEYEENRITKEQAEEIVRNGGVLVDVRSQEEFNEYHLDNAVNLPHNIVFENINTVAPTKDIPLIVACRTGKRADMAKLSLEYLYYDNIYTLVF